MTIEDYKYDPQVTASKGFKRVVELLLDAGADVNARGGEYGKQQLSEVPRELSRMALVIVKIRILGLVLMIYLWL